MRIAWSDVVAEPYLRGGAQTGETALHSAAAGGHALVVQLLLERGANKDIKHNVRATPGPCSGALRCVTLASGEACLQRMVCAYL